MSRPGRWMAPLGVGLLMLTASASAQAKAAYMELDEAVQAAEVVAVVHVEETEACEVQGEHWTYAQRVSASTRAVVKGTLSPRVEILAEKDFVCAPVHYDAPADYLVFLEHDHEHWVTLNHGMGRLSIDEAGNVSWPYDGGQPIPLPGALTRIRGALGEETRTEIALVHQPSEPELEPEPTSEPQPCGLLLRDEAPATEAAQESTASMPDALAHRLAMLGGGLAVLAGFWAGWRRRTRRRRS